MEQKLLIIFLALSGLTPILCQTNGVRLNLIPCYNASFLPEVVIADTRPPVTLNIFIEFVRRLEDANPTLTARELSVLILQRLRQDGIMDTGRNTDIRFGIPFSPKRLEAYKTTLILQRFLTNSSLELSPGDLNAAEICSFHYIISSTIDNRLRSDEATTCARSSRYTSRIFRKRRDLDEATTTAVPEAGPTDVENIEVEGVEGFGVRSITSNLHDISQCPIELGVVFNTYGTIKAGQVLAGIATGFNQEVVLGADNRFAATIAGEIAEAALVQANDTIVVGAEGGWNSTINPRYYFLQRNTLLQATDAEIRGSLDGLYMGLRLDSWRSTFSDIKISQILDLYYSPFNRGVFDRTFRACNRNILYTQMTTNERMQSEIFNFMGPLDDASQYRQTVSPSAYMHLTTVALNSFNNYLPRMNTTDLSCRQDDSPIERVATDLLIFLDASWDFNTIQSTLPFVLDNIDVNRFGTRYTVFNGRDGLNITTNNTRYILDFYRQFNRQVHNNLTREFDYNRVSEELESIGRQKLSSNNYTGGESTIALLMPRTVPNEAQNTFFTQRREIFREIIPDLTILVLGIGTQADYNSIVTTPTRDVILLTELPREDQSRQVGQSLVERIRNVPRAIVNPNCGPEFTGPSSTFSLVQYVEPGGINYYRISPHYFFSGEGTRNLRVTENGFGAIEVCISREQNRPNNLTSECETLRAAVRTVDITGFCDGGISDCAPIYISVAGNDTLTRCNDPLCRFPDDIRYTITLENVGCTRGGAIRVVANFFVIAALFFVLGF